MNHVGNVQNRCERGINLYDLQMKREGGKIFGRGGDVAARSKGTTAREEKGT